MMDANKLREQFEQWAKDRYSWHLHDDARDPEERTLASWNGETYGNRIVEGMWQAWNGSREAVVIEIPCGYDPYRANGDPDMLNVNDTLQECREAIEAQGFKVAP